MRTDPAVSVPKAKSTSPAATATAEPDEDPPQMRAGFHGFTGRGLYGLPPEGSYASGVISVNPRRAAPLDSIVEITGAVRAGLENGGCANPHVGARPDTSTRSLIA